MAGQDLSNMNYSNSNYHPSWENREFDQKQYKEELEKLKGKQQDKWLICENNSFKAVGLISYIAHTIKGWFYKDVQTDAVRVNYQLLKFIRYGQTHHFFDNSQIKTLILELQKVLAQDQQEDPYKATSKLIAQIASSSIPFDAANANIENEIKRYYSNNRESLQDPTLVRVAQVFSSSSQAIVPNTAAYHYNMGRIHASEDHPLQAVESFEKAVEITPNKHDWQLELAGNALKAAKMMIKVGEPVKAIMYLNKTIKSASNCPDEAFKNEVVQILSEAYNWVFAVEVKLDRPQQAIEAFTKSEKLFSHSMTSSAFMESYEALQKDNLSIATSDSQRGEIYCLLGRKLIKEKGSQPFALSPIPFIKKGITHLTTAISKEGFNNHLGNLLVDAYLNILIHELNNPAEARAHLIQALEYFKLFEASGGDKAEVELLSHRIIPFLKAVSAQAAKNKEWEVAIDFARHLKIALQASDKKAQVAADIAEMYRELGDKESALKEMSEASKLNPELNPRLVALFVAFGEEAEAKGEFAQAIEYYKQAKSYDPKNDSISKKIAQAYTLLVDQETQKGKTLEAIEHLKLAQAQDPTNEKITARLIKIYLELAEKEQGSGKLHTAVDYLTKVNALDPKNIHTLSKLVNLEISQENWAEASKWIVQTIALQPTYENHLQAANIFARLANKPKAIEHAEQAIKLRPAGNNAAILIHYELQQGMVNAANTKEAIANCLQILQIRPNDLNVIIQLATAYQTDNRDDEAIPLLNKMIEIDKKGEAALKAHTILAEIYAKRQDWHNSLTYYRQAEELAEDPSRYNKEIFENQRQIFTHALKQKNYQALLEIAKSDIFHRTSDAALKRALALDLIKSGDEAFASNSRYAFEVYKLAIPHLEAKTDDEVVCSVLLKYASDARNTRQYEQEVDYLEQVCRLDPKNIAVLKDLSKANIAANRLLQAEQILEELVQLDPLNSSHYHDTLAELHQKTKDIDKVIAAYQKALESAPEHQKITSVVNLLLIASALFKTEAQNEPAKVAAAKEKALGIFLMLEPFLLKLDGVKYQKDIVTAYIALGQSKAKDKPGQALEYYFKAGQIDPHLATWKASWIFEMGDLHKRLGQAELAIKAYRKAQDVQTLQPDALNPTSMRNFAEIEALMGNQFYERGLFDFAQLQKKLNELADYADKSTEIRDTFGVDAAFSGLSYFYPDVDNFNKFVKAAREAKTPYQVGKSAQDLIGLLEKAYDGQQGRPKAAPLEMTQAIQYIRTQFEYLQDFYLKLVQKTEEFVAIARLTPHFAKAFADWEPGVLSSNLHESAQVTEKAKNALDAFDLALKKEGAPKPSPLLQASANRLRQALTTHVWNHLAIDHFNKCLEVMPGYGPHCNKLIDAYVRVGDYVKAIETYNQMLVKFPSQTPLVIDPIAYVKVAENKALQGKLGKGKLFSGLLNAATDHARRQEFDKAIDVFKQAIEHSDGQAHVVAERLLELGHQLSESGELKMAYDAYAAGKPHMGKLNLSPQAKFTIFIDMGSLARSQNLYAESEENYLKAIEIENASRMVKSANLRYELALTYEARQNLDQALEFHQQALKLDPTNNKFKLKVAATVVALGNRAYDLAVAEQTRQQLGKHIAEAQKKFTDFYKHMQICLHSNAIVKALGKRWGSWSTENTELKGFLSNPSSDAATLVAEGMRALELLSTAYDGGSNHMKPSDLPSDVAFFMQNMRELLGNIQNAQQFLDAHPAIQGKASAEKALWTEATGNYKRVWDENPGLFGEHINKWIDAYVKQGNFPAAIQYFDLFQQRFKNEAPNLVLDPKAYTSYTQDLLAKNKMDQALEYIKAAIKSVEAYPNQAVLLDALRKEQSRIYVATANIYASKNFTDKALEWFDKATKCGTTPPAEYYAGMAKLYYNAYSNKTSLDPAQPYVQADQSHSLHPYHKAAIENYHQAVKAQPDHPQYLIELGKRLSIAPRGAIWSISEWKDPVPYLRQAVLLDPKSVNAAFWLQFALGKMVEHQTNNKQGRPYTKGEYEEAMKHVKALGGSTFKAPKDVEAS